MDGLLKLNKDVKQLFQLYLYDASYNTDHMQAELEESMKRTMDLKITVQRALQAWEDAGGV